MSYPIVLLWLFGGLFLAYMLFGLWRRIETAKLERMLQNMPFPDVYRPYLRRIAHYNALGSDERTRVERTLLRFLHTKEFRGVGLEVTDEMRVVVAFYAALTVRGKQGDSYARLATVLLYSGPFLVEEKINEHGIVTSGEFELDGQSSEDTIVLSWEDTRREAYELSPDNVVIHECAHLLDFSEGEGNPWIEAVDEAYGAYIGSLHGDGGHSGTDVLGEYAAENEAEFFAVSSERFFHAPLRLKAAFPGLYEALEGFYGWDPARLGVEAEWPRNDGAA